MPVPKYHELYAPFLKTLKDGSIHTIKEIKQSVADQMHLTDADLAELLPSGKQTVFDNRIAPCMVLHSECEESRLFYVG